MKFISFFFVFVTAIIGETNAQFKISSSGNIGIGTTNPQYKLDLEGTARFSGWTDLILDWGAMYGSPQLYPEKDWYLFIGKPNNRIGHFYVVDVDYTNLYKVSDSRLKHDVVPLNSSLSQIRKVTAVRYKLNEDTKRSSLSKNEPTRKDLSKKEYLGFIAQDLRKIFPELVETNEDGYLKVDYISMIPILVEAFNEQQEIVDAQSAKIKELDAKISKLESDRVGGKKEILQNLTGEISLVKNSYLYQNTPNPFSLSTEIKYFLSQEVENAFMCIFDMQGGLKKKIPMTGTGMGAIQIESGELKPGMYLYTLIANGIEVDTKKMILTDV